MSEAEQHYVRPSLCPFHRHEDRLVRKNTPAPSPPHSAATSCMHLPHSGGCALLSPLVQPQTRVQSERWLKTEAGPCTHHISSHSVGNEQGLCGGQATGPALGHTEPGWPLAPSAQLLPPWLSSSHTVPQEG